MDNETLESRLAALRVATTKRNPQVTELHERLFAELAEYLRYDYRQLGFPELTPGTGWKLPIPRLP